MLIKIDDYIINLDNVKEISFDGFKISFMYSGTEIRKIDCENKDKIFNEIIAYYNDGRKVYVVE